MFGIKGLAEYYKEKRKTDAELRDLAFDTVKSSNEFLFKVMKKTGSKEYWDWRLDFDMKRYGIKFWDLYTMLP